LQYSSTARFCSKRCLNPLKQHTPEEAKDYCFNRQRKKTNDYTDKLLKNPFGLKMEIRIEKLTVFYVQFVTNEPCFIFSDRIDLKGITFKKCLAFNGVFDANSHQICHLFMQVFQEYSKSIPRKPVSCLMLHFLNPIEI